jgi:hypothetical protein
MTARRAERAYALLLRAYPSGFRAAFGREMTTTFRGLVRDSGSPGVRFWMEIIADVARSAPAQHADALRARWNSNQRMEESRMKAMGILAVGIGLLQSVNGIIELTHGGAAGLPGLVVALAVVLGVLLVAAGVALLRGAAIASTLAALAAVCWLALVVIVRAVHPWMSIFSMLLAVVFPIALLLYVWMGRGRGHASAV